MTEADEKDPEFEEWQERQKFKRHMEWYDGDGHLYRHFLGHIHKFFLEAGLGVADTLEKGLAAIRKIIGWMIWLSAILETQKGWLNRLLALVGFLVVVMFVSMLFWKNRDNLLSLIGN